MLEELPLLTATAVTGPGILVPSPTAAHVAFAKSYCATLAVEPLDSVIDPAAIRTSWLFCRSKVNYVMPPNNKVPTPAYETDEMSP